MNDINIMNQQQIAQEFYVDRTTVRAWTKCGLPFIQGDQGDNLRQTFGNKDSAYRA